jgi:hypothetical protein
VGNLARPEPAEAAMTVRAIAATLALLFTAAIAVPVSAEKTVTLRVAVALRSDVANPENQKWLRKGLKDGMHLGYGWKLEVVDVASAPDAVVDVTYQLDPGPADLAGALVVAKIEGREVHTNALPMKRALFAKESWLHAGVRLGRDVAVILKSIAKPLPAPTTESIVERLSGRDPVKRAEAANQAARLGAEGKAVVPALLAVLADNRPLRQIGGRGTDTTPALQAGNALKALGASTELLAFFRSKASGSARANALMVIASSLANGYRDAIFEALDDDNGDVRTVAARLAGTYLGRPAVPKLIGIIEGKGSRAVREAAWRSLRLLGDKDFEFDAAAWRQWWASQAQATSATVKR